MHYGKKRFYKQGKAAPRLCNVRFIKRIDRTKADQLVAEIVRRAKEINARPELAMTVEEIRAFGSYITDRTDLGDIDLAVRFERKPGKDFVAWNIERANASGRQSLNFFQQITYGETEVFRLLKGRSPYIALHYAHDLEKIGAASKVIFTHAGP